MRLINLAIDLTRFGLLSGSGEALAHVSQAACVELNFWAGIHFYLFKAAHIPSSRLQLNMHPLALVRGDVAQRIEQEALIATT